MLLCYYYIYLIYLQYIIYFIIIIIYIYNQKAENKKMHQKQIKQQQNSKPSLMPNNKNKQALQITQAFLYFSNPFTSPINQSVFESHINKLHNIPSHSHLINKCLSIAIQRYYQIVNNYESMKIEQYLMIKMLGWIHKLVIMRDNINTNITNMSELQNKKVQQNTNKKYTKQQQQSLVIIIYANVTHIRKCIPQKQYKQLIFNILMLVQICIHKLLTYSVSQLFKIEMIYPQISACVMHFVMHPQICNIGIFRICLAVMGQILSTLFNSFNFNNKSDKISQNKLKQINQLIHNTNTVNDDNIKINIANNNNNKIANTFQEECLTRLQAYFKLLVTKLPLLQLSYHQQLWPLCNSNKHIKILCPLAILGQLAGSSLNYSSLSPSTTKIIQSSLTHQFISIIQNSNSSLLQRTQTLKRLQSLSSYINPNYQQIQQILQKLTNQIYLISNSNILIIPHVDIIHRGNLQQLKQIHSFSNYSVGINGILDIFNNQCEKVLLQKLPYAQANLINIVSMKKILYNMNNQTTNLLLQHLLEFISKQQDQYMVDGSLTAFCQFLTKLLIIYWLVSKCKNNISNSNNNKFKLRQDIAFGLFQILSTSQAIKILKAGFQLQQVLIGFSLMICYYCYSSIIATNQNNNQNTINLSQIKKLKLKLSLFQCTINNIYQQSYIIKSSSYFIMLAQSAPLTIGETLHNLQSTLINRNINNLQFVIALIKLCPMSEVQSQDLAQKFIKYYGSQELVKLLLPKLSTKVIRKCLLSMPSQKGKWIHLLLQNTKLLSQKQLSIQQSSLEAKGQNFYMNDGPNVRITNALGVILLQLGNKWEYALHIQCPYRQPALDLLIQLINIDQKMVFFKVRFISILECIYKILEKQIQGKSSERIGRKIYFILAKLPEQNYRIYLLKIKQGKINEKNKKQTKLKKKMQKQQELNVLQKILELINKRHKKCQLNYLTNPNVKQYSQMYDNSDEIITKITNTIGQSSQQTDAKQNIIQSQDLNESI